MTPTPVYETDALLAQYLLFHYGRPDEVLPWPGGPRDALDYATRVVDEGRRLLAAADAWPSGGRALDVGAAVGGSSFALARTFDDVIGVDLSRRFIDAATTLARDGRLEKLLDIPWPHSPGRFYETITLLLGFRPARHEGKITGLAALGDPSVVGPYARTIFGLCDDRDDFYTHPDLHLWRWDYRKKKEGRPLPKGLRNYSREDIAAAWQTVLEESIVGLVKRYLDRYPDIRHVALAGGVYAVFFGDAFVTGQWWFVGADPSDPDDKGIPISSVLVFDIGVYLGVFGSILTLVLALEEEV